MAIQIQVRRDSAANWASTDPVPAQGEPCYETDTGKLKYGDGATAYSLLPYSAAPDNFDLQSVTDNGASTTNAIIANGGLTASTAVVTGGLTVDTDTLYVDATNDRVGVNTVPTVTLHGLQPAEGEVLRLDTVNTSRSLKLGSFTTSVAGAGWDFDAASSAGAFSWSVAGAEKMRIKSNGNVGIGTSSPDKNLEVSGTTPTIRITDTQNKSWTAGESIGQLEWYTEDGSGSGARVAASIDVVSGAVSTQPYGNMVFNTSGASTEQPVMTLTHDGRVGIGTTNPSGIGGGADLAVNKTGGARFVINNSSRQWAIRGDSGSDDLRVTLRGGGDTTDVDALTVNASGNVGIGTSSPSRTLDVFSANQVVAEFDGSSVAPQIIISRNGTQRGGFEASVSPSAFTVLNSLDALVLQTADTERMRIDSSGNVGIGASPVATNYSGTNTTTYIESASAAALTLDSTGGSGRSFSLVSGTAGALDVFDEDAASIRMRIDSSGNVGIGTAPATLLHIADATSPILRISESGVRSWDVEVDGGAFTVTDATAATERLRVDTSGNLLVGTTTSNPAGTVVGVQIASGSGNTRFSATTTATFEHQGFYNGNGKVGSIQTSASATAFNTSSDVRLKENIQDADSSGSVIDAIQVRQYDWKADGSHQRYGFVAQELDLVYPEAVSKGETEEDTWGVDYSKLVPLLVKSVQELSAELNSVKAELEALKNA